MTISTVFTLLSIAACPLPARWANLRQSHLQLLSVLDAHGILNGGGHHDIAIYGDIISAARIARLAGAAHPTIPYLTLVLVLDEDGLLVIDAISKLNLLGILDADRILDVGGNGNATCHGRCTTGDRPSYPGYVSCESKPIHGTVLRLTTAAQAASTGVLIELANVDRALHDIGSSAEANSFLGLNVGLYARHGLLNHFAASATTTRTSEPRILVQSLDIGAVLQDVPFTFRILILVGLLNSGDGLRDLSYGRGAQPQC